MPAALRGSLLVTAVPWVTRARPAARIGRVKNVAHDGVSPVTVAPSAAPSSDAASADRDVPPAARLTGVDIGDGTEWHMYALKHEARWSFTRARWMSKRARGGKLNVLATAPCAQNPAATSAHATVIYKQRLRTTSEPRRLEAAAVAPESGDGVAKEARLPRELSRRTPPATTRPPGPPTPPGMPTPYPMLPPPSTEPSRDGERGLKLRSTYDIAGEWNREPPHGPTYGVDNMRTRCDGRYTPMSSRSASLSCSSRSSSPAATT
jgi:hypothetical protein